MFFDCHWAARHSDRICCSIQTAVLYNEFCSIQIEISKGQQRSNIYAQYFPSIMLNVIHIFFTSLTSSETYYTLKYDGIDNNWKVFIPLSNFSCYIIDYMSHNSSYSEYL